jgi:GH24 family phage-related lysozyme (muramidase)
MTALTGALRDCPVLASEPEGRLAAIVDFTFNLGAVRLQTSTLAGGSASIGQHQRGSSADGSDATGRT